MPICGRWVGGRVCVCEPLNQADIHISVFCAQMEKKIRIFIMCVCVSARTGPITSVYSDVPKMLFMIDPLDIIRVGSFWLVYGFENSYALPRVVLFDQFQLAQ